MSTPVSRALEDRPVHSPSTCSSSATLAACLVVPPPRLAGRSYSGERRIRYSRPAASKSSSAKVSSSGAL
ncbi:hypothetical protein [Rathayibacter sp. VKM Ac-2759]|uniref:hypothetical protein n=1 Tax=Rathayibacter sp. VKM Ac-2759 TaxID=2609252 RepID=UPI0014207BEF|nr:hypothetical protein [Rathayibacter sp. VKM Ac-2759]